MWLALAILDIYCYNDVRSRWRTAFSKITIKNKDYSTTTIYSQKYRKYIMQPCFRELWLTYSWLKKCKQCFFWAMFGLTNLEGAYVYFWQKMKQHFCLEKQSRMIAIWTLPPRQNTCIVDVKHFQKISIFHVSFAILWKEWQENLLAGQNSKPGNITTFSNHFI